MTVEERTQRLAELIRDAEFALRQAQQDSRAAARRVADCEYRLKVLRRKERRREGKLDESDQTSVREERGRF